jgi:hypothetical protein
MPTVTISNRAMDAIRKSAERPITEGVRTGPDEWRVPLKDTTIDRINEAKLEGESISDAILRVVATAGRRPQ